MGKTLAAKAELPSCSSSCWSNPGSTCCCLIWLYTALARRFSIITPGMRISLSQTAKSETEACGGNANRYLPSSACATWLSKICSTRTRACWLSISTSTFITCNESVAGSGLLLVEGIRVPDCAEPCCCGQLSSNKSKTKASIAKKALLVRARFSLWRCIVFPPLHCWVPVGERDTGDTARRAEVDIFFIARDAEHR